MPQSNSNKTVCRWDGVDISGQWTGEVTHEQSVEDIATDAGSNATHRQRNAGLIDITSEFVFMFGTEQAERALAFNTIKVGDKGIFMHSPEGEDAGNPVFEANMLVVSKSGPTSSQNKSVFKVCTLSLAIDGTPIRTLEDDVH